MFEVVTPSRTYYIQVYRDYDMCRPGIIRDSLATFYITFILYK